MNHKRHKPNPKQDAYRTTELARVERRRHEPLTCQVDNCIRVHRQPVHEHSIHVIEQVCF